MPSLAWFLSTKDKNATHDLFTCAFEQKQINDYEEENSVAAIEVYIYISIEDKEKDIHDSSLHF